MAAVEWESGPRLSQTVAQLRLTAGTKDLAHLEGDAKSSRARCRWQHQPVPGEKKQPERWHPHFCYSSRRSAIGPAVFKCWGQRLRKEPALTDVWQISSMINWDKGQPVATATLLKALSPSKPRGLGTQPCAFTEVTSFS